MDRAIAVKDKNNLTTENTEMYTEKDYPDKELTEKIIKAAINVHRILGPVLLKQYMKVHLK